jgi:hypothetical protein
MIIDCKEWKTSEICKSEQRRVFVDGVEIKQVFYVDTEAGLVRTYDVLGDGEAHAVRRGFHEICHQESDFPGRDISAPLNGPLSETIRGAVTLRPWV